VDETQEFLIIGLGNPGSAYQQTRHNAGYLIVEAFAKKQQLTFKQSSNLVGGIARGEVHGKKVTLLLPTTYMNTSGEAVRRCMDYYKVPVDQVMVVCDDVALPLGTLRMRSKGSSGGHNGLKSIEAHVHTQYYARLRVGVGAPGGQILADYVLGRFSSEESKTLLEVSQKAVEVLELWMRAGIATAMQAANSAKEDEKKEEEGEQNG
jgi:PTH1 family peptidyl-tRNA hydrolase